MSSGLPKPVAWFVSKFGTVLLFIFKGKFAKMPVCEAGILEAQ